MNYATIPIVSVLSKHSKSLSTNTSSYTQISTHFFLHFNKYNLLHLNQFRFGKKHCGQTVLTSLVDQWLTNKSNDELNSVMLVD